MSLASPKGLKRGTYLNKYPCSKLQIVSNVILTLAFGLVITGCSSVQYLLPRVTHQPSPIPKGMVTGILVLSDGSPVGEDIQVTPAAWDELEQSCTLQKMEWVSTITDYHGAFVLSRLSPRKYCLILNIPSLGFSDKPIENHGLSGVVEKIDLKIFTFELTDAAGVGLGKVVVGGTTNLYNWGE